MAAVLAVRLGAALDREDLRQRARRTVETFSASLEKIPESAPLMLCALVEAEEPPRTLFVVGDGGAPVFPAEVSRAHRALMPGRVVIPAPVSERDSLDRLGVPLADKGFPDGAAAAYLCEDAACRPWS